MTCPFVMEELEGALKGMQNGRSPGHDNIMNDASQEETPGPIQHELEDRPDTLNLEEGNPHPNPQGRQA